MSELLFATGNASKLAQLRFVVDHLNMPIDIVGARERYGDDARYDECGSTVEEVAQRGALEVARRVDRPVMTEDTDFCIDALGGEPGIHAGPFLATYGRGEILKRMRNRTNRTAIINSAVAFAQPNGDCIIFSNHVAGTIANREHSGNFPDWIAPTPSNRFGGGYNAIFIPDGWQRTLAEISPTDAIPWSYREGNFVAVLKHVYT